MTTIAKALNAAMADALAVDPKVLVMGEDVGTLGGVFRITDGLKERFGGLRVIDTPLAESGIVGTAISPALSVASQLAAIIRLFGPRSSTRLPGTSPMSSTSTCAMRSTSAASSA